MAGLRLDTVSKIYGSRARTGIVAVDRLSLELGDGQVMALLGSSGCGKTSTLRMIAGFEAVSDGTISLGTRAIQDLPPAKREVAMAFEGYSLYPPLDLRNNIAFALLRDRVAKAEVDKKVAEVATMLEIGDILGRYPATIASGQQQRASLARALVRRADLYLLDEPMSQLEPRLRAILRARLKDWLNSRQMTTVFVTHDQTEAVALADRIAVMEKGILQQYGSPEELRERPANLFVAGFIGEPAMTLMPATIARTGNALAVIAVQGQLYLDLPVGTVDLADGAPVHLGLRPHRLTIGGGTVSGPVIANFWAGDQSHVAIEVAGERIVAAIDGQIDAPLNSTISFGVPAAAIHLFDHQSGLALAHGGVRA